MTQNFYPVIGSAGNRMKCLYELLRQHNIEIDVLTTEPAYPSKELYTNQAFWYEDHLNQNAERIFRIPIQKSSHSPSLIRRLFFYLEMSFRFFYFLWLKRHVKYDFIYVSTPPIFIVFSALFGKALLRAKLILEVRDLWPDSLEGVNKFNHPLILHVFRKIEKKMYNLADFIVINSMGFKEHIESKLKNKNTPIIYLPNGPRIKELVSSKQYHDEFCVIYSGNLGLAQDIERLKRFSKLLHHKDIRFVVIGYGVKFEEFARFVKEQHLSNVVVKQPTTRKESLEWISKCHVAIAFLNKKDVFSTVLPGKIVDYMTCKTPIIACVEGVAAQTIVKNDVGYVFHHDDLVGMVNQIAALKEDDLRRTALEENCLETVRNKFLFDQNIKQLVEIVNHSTSY